MYVLVKDENGGHSKGSVDVRVGGPEVMFSGSVGESGATVSVNGQSTKTNEQGYFFVQLPQAEIDTCLISAKTATRSFHEFYLRNSLAPNSVW